MSFWPFCVTIFINFWSFATVPNRRYNEVHFVKVSDQTVKNWQSCCKFSFEFLFELFRSLSAVIMAQPQPSNAAAKLAAAGTRKPSRSYIDSNNAVFTSCNPLVLIDISHRKVSKICESRSAYLQTPGREPRPTRRQTERPSRSYIEPSNAVF